jgi:hypothetical protein
MKMVYVSALSLLFFALLSASATVIDVPDDYETIQQGIDASTDGDTVLVQPGTYVENINFDGHNVVLGSLFLTTGDSDFIAATVIDGDSAGSVVAFQSGEDRTAVIVGFSVLNGYAEYGAGIFCFYSDPVIQNNIIASNYAEGRNASGGGICCDHSDAIILCNRIEDNIAFYWLTFAGAGGGLYLSFSDAAICNTIFWSDGAFYGNEIYANNASTLVISHTDIQDTLWPGEGNISIGPLFHDPENGDYHLMSAACGDLYDWPCIDAGQPDILDSLLDCSRGLGELRSDMGAYGGGDSVTVGMDPDDIPMPQTFSLSQNYPNPFNASTIICYALPEAADVRIEIFDIIGRRIETFIHEKQQAGYYQVIWNGERRSSGAYFYRIQAADYFDTRKMVLIK